MLPQCFANRSTEVDVVETYSTPIEAQRPARGSDSGSREYTSVRYPRTRNAIAPARVLAHSDVAPARKQDPGEKFPWRTLYESGVGHWVKPAPIMDFGQVLTSGSRGEAVAALQKSLREYGYGVEASGEYDPNTAEVVTAFQRHFRPERIDGQADPSTRSTLQELLASRGRPRTIAARARTAMLRVAP